MASSKERTLEPAEFRLQAREWLARAMAELGDEARRPQLPEEQDPDLKRRYAHLQARDGWSGLTWDPRFGGRGLDLRDLFIFCQESVAANAPDPLSRVGIDIIGQALMAHADNEQLERLLPPMLRAEQIWCQGFSEPDAGSDLASLRTRATHVDGGWALSGQKIWTSFANHADMCFVLARTDPSQAPHKGLSMFAVDLKAPGLTIRPIQQITGSNEFCEVFYDGVFVPDDHLIGLPGDGWSIAMTALGIERSTNFMMRQLRLSSQVDELLRRVRDHRRQISSDVVDRLLAAYISSVELASVVEYHHIVRIGRGETPGADSSATKILWSETFQDVADIGLTLDMQLGPDPAGTDWTYSYIFSRAATIYSGTSEIQRNIIAERGLGLPR
jgi:alkylation response protein AidB-like acyl-CoA dehydrogenase